MANFRDEGSEEDGASHFYEPSPRFAAVTSANTEELYLYGGYAKNFEKIGAHLTKSIQIYDSYTEQWREVPTKGTPPQGLYSCAATYSDNYIYTYSGITLDKISYSDSLYQLETRTFTWTELSSHHENSPMGKAGYGLIYYDNSILICCGYGKLSGEVQQGAQFIIDTNDEDGEGWTNEIHMFNIAEGTWSIPHITGIRPPPCSDFTLNKISPTQAIFFGGHHTHIDFNHTFLLDLTKMHFTKLLFLNGNPQPAPRHSHISVCLGYGSDHPQLLVHGGLDNDGKVLNDIWCLHIKSTTWKEITASGIQPRCYHCAAALNISPELAEVVIFGGCFEIPSDWESEEDLEPIAGTTVLNFEKQSTKFSTESSLEKEWILKEVINTNKLGNVQRIRKKKLIKDKKYEEACQQAIQKQLAVDIYVGRLNFLGLPRSGKSSTLRRLIGEIINILTANMRTEQPSTGVAERKQLFIKSINKSYGVIAFGEWSKKNLVGETRVLNEIIYQSIQGTSENVDITKKVEIKNHIDSQSNETQSISKETSKTNMESTTSPIHENLISTETSETKAHENQTVNVANVFSLFEKAMEQKDYDTAKYLLRDTVYLIATDHGGQTEFLDLMSRFLMGPSLNLIFSRLTDSLDEVFKIYCTNEEGISTDKEDSIVTLEEVIFQTLASIASMNVTNDSDKVSPDTPSLSKALFVGTFRDKVSNRLFKKRDRLLKEKIEKTEFYHKKIIQYASKEHLILDVNNFSGNEEEIARARLLFETLLKKNFGKVHTPCTWLMLSSNIRSENKRAISIDECKKMAINLGIDPDDLPLVLWFLHYRVGVLFYYPDVKGFKNIIIIDIQIIFDAANQLVKRTFVFGKAEKATIEAFKNKAQFTLSELRKATEDCVGDIISIENIVTLFEHHKILAVLPPEGESKEVTYFMPSVLKSSTPNELCQIQSFSQVAPLMFRYKCGYMPLGVFSALIVSLVSSNNPKWRLKEDNLSRNKIDFLVGDYLHTVTLINQPTFLKVVVQSQSSLPTPTASLCHYIRTILTDALNSVNASLNYNSAKFEYAFECPSCWTIFQEKHLSVVQGNTYNSMICLKDRQKTKVIVVKKAKHTIWFQEENQSPQNAPVNEEDASTSVLDITNTATCHTFKDVNKSATSTPNITNAVTSHIIKEDVNQSEPLLPNVTNAATPQHICLSEPPVLEVTNVAAKSSSLLDDSPSGTPTLQDKTKAKDASTSDHPFTMKSLTLMKWTDSNLHKHRLQLINLISPKWKKAGDLLGLTPDHTQRIEMNNKTVEECCREVMAQWLTNTEGMYQYSTNWEGLCELLEDLELSTAARELHNLIFPQETDK